MWVVQVTFVPSLLVTTQPASGTAEAAGGSWGLSLENHMIGHGFWFIVKMKEMEKHCCGF